MCSMLWERQLRKFRNKLGESLSTVQKFDTPLEQATTPSLEALKAFSSGRQSCGYEPGRPQPFHFSSMPSNSTRILPSPTLYLGRMYGDMKEYGLAADYTRKAYELRDRTSEPEKYFISASSIWWSLGTSNKPNNPASFGLRLIRARRCRTITWRGLIYPVLGQYERGA